MFLTMFKGFTTFWYSGILNFHPLWVLLKAHRWHHINHHQSLKKCSHRKKNAQLQSKSCWYFICKLLLIRPPRRNQFWAKVSRAIYIKKILQIYIKKVITMCPTSVWVVGCNHFCIYNNLNNPITYYILILFRHYRSLNLITNEQMFMHKRLKYI